MHRTSSEALNRRLTPGEGGRRHPGFERSPPLDDWAPSALDPAAATPGGMTRWFRHATGGAYSSPVILVSSEARRPGSTSSPYLDPGFVLRPPLDDWAPSALDPTAASPRGMTQYPIRHATGRAQRLSPVILVSSEARRPGSTPSPHLDPGFDLRSPQDD
jgi:hypothetical protein